MKVSGRWKLTTNVIVLTAACLVLVESLVFVSDLMVRPPLEGLENQIFDLAFQVNEHNPALDKFSIDNVVIIDIDDASIEKLGRAQLWPRSYDARVINNIAAGGAKCIGIDFLYTEPDTLSQEYARILEAKGFENPDSIIMSLSTDKDLQNSIESFKNVYLGFFDDDTKKDSSTAQKTINELRLIQGKRDSEIHFPVMHYPVLPIASFSESAKAVGAISMPSMNDGTIRYYHLLHRINTDASEPDLVGNFPFYMVLDELGVSESHVEITKDGVELGSKAFVPLLPDGTFRLNWLGGEEKIRYISYYKILDELIPIEFFENKYVFFGTSASGLQDLKTVPSKSEKMPGVEVHAVAFLNMMNAAYIREISEKKALPYFFLICALLVLGFLHIKPIWGFVFAVVLIFTEMFVFVLWVLPTAQTVFPIVTLMLLSFLAYTSASLFTYFIKEKKNRELKNAFGRYVSPDVVEQIIKNASALQLGGAKRRLTVLFSDIRGFTTYSEQLDPQELVSVLNNYLSQMSEVVFAHKGTIDKFVGDAIMAIFGAPINQEDHADRACRVAIGMIRCLKNVNMDQTKRGQPSLAIGIGLNTGEMTVGNIGSHRRIDYTVIGDAVNLGSRLEDLTKFFRVEILVSESTKNSCTPGEFIFRELASVKVMGKDTPVVVFQLIGSTKEDAEFAIALDLWRDAYSAYKNKELENALQLFTSYLQQAPKDATAKFYMDRCNEFLHEPDKLKLTFEMDKK